MTGTPAPEATPLRVLHVAETAKGGVGSYIDDVASLQIERHGQGAVRVVLPDAHAAQLQRVPASVQRHFRAAGNRLFNSLRMVRATWRELAEWQPDVVHLHSTFAGFALRPLLAWRGARPRIVYCSHGWAFDREGHARANALFAWVERVWSRWCDAVVCVSAHELREGERIGIQRGRLRLVNNGIRDLTATPDTSALPVPWPPHQRRVLFVGRLDRQKGVDVLFEAMRQLEGKAFALVVGTAVVADTSAGPMPPNVRIVGWLERDRITAYYAAADVVVISSRWEAFSLVAVEAMRAGRTVVATAVGGLRDVVLAGVTGRLVPAEDPAALAAEVDRLTADELGAMGAAGRARFEACFRIERVVDELEAIYQAAQAPDRTAPLWATLPSAGP